eukprot:scaffold2524_cov86-Skeletonema_dohrnii-CCMP3373.AAC.2
MGDVQVIVISAGGGLIELNDIISIPHGSASQQQASQNGGDCGDDDDPQCMIRQVEVEKKLSKLWISLRGMGRWPQYSSSSK